MELATITFKHNKNECHHVLLHVLLSTFKKKHFLSLNSSRNNKVDIARGQGQYIKEMEESKVLFCLRSQCFLPEEKLQLVINIVFGYSRKKLCLNCDV